MNSTLVKQGKRPRISAATGLPIHSVSVERRIAMVKQQLGWDKWDSIRFDMSRLVDAAN